MNLVQKAKFDPHAFIGLYDLYAERVYQYFLRRLQAVHEAEDLSSAVWEKVLAKIQTLKSDQEEVFLSWLFAIARNELNQYFRQKQKLLSEELTDLVSDSAKKPDDLTRDETDANLLRHALLSLSAQQRETVELRYFADLRNKEIAVILGVSEKTVASNLSRALKTLEAYLRKLQ